ncbi:MAG: hypothetical protein GKR94_17645 [Gammaproteobacteria bacterium]|nr:hypothetical protein [Gammaproteobacteria bacterium]
MRHGFGVAALALTLAIAGLEGASRTAYAAAGAPPKGALPAPKTGAELKHACGQSDPKFSGLVGEITFRQMLITQCRGLVTGVADLINASEVTFEGKPVWQCVQDRTDYEALAASFVKWVGRRPALMRKAASIAFVEAIEMSAPCPK